MERAGVALDRYELIAGELILKMGKKSPHMRALWLLVQYLRRAVGDPFVAQEVSISVDPLDTPTSEPEPDAVVLNVPFPQLTGLAGTGDLRLVAEVSGATLSFDLTVKAALYARAGIAEYWVLDVERRRLVMHRRPDQGVYRDIAAYAEDETVATLAAPERTVRVAELF